MSSDANRQTTPPSEDEPVLHVGDGEQPAGDDTSITEKPQTVRDAENSPSPAREPADAAPASDEQNPPLPDEQIPLIDTNAPPLPDEAPPLPDEAPPGDDGWEPMWDSTAQAYYFHNRYTKVTQWENPRVPEGATSTTGELGAHNRISGAPGTLVAPGTSSPPTAPRLHGGYNPAIHGDYDPSADYAKEAAADERAAENQQEMASASAAQYVASGSFNRFTGRWQNTEVMNPENFNDENKSKRQMNAFFDVDAAANSHDGRSLKAERAGKRLSKQEVKAYKDKRRERKEEKRRAWLRD